MWNEEGNADVAGRDEGMGLEWETWRLIFMYLKRSGEGIIIGIRYRPLFIVTIVYAIWTIIPVSCPITYGLVLT